MIPVPATTVSENPTFHFIEQTTRLTRVQSVQVGSLETKRTGKNVAIQKSQSIPKLRPPYLYFPISVPIVKFLCNFTSQGGSYFKLLYFVSALGCTCALRIQNEATQEIITWHHSSPDREAQDDGQGWERGRETNYRDCPGFHRRKTQPRHNCDRAPLLPVD